MKCRVPGIATVAIAGLAMVCFGADSAAPYHGGPPDADWRFVFEEQSS